MNELVRRMKRAMAIWFKTGWLIVVLAGPAPAADVRVATAATNALPARPAAKVPIIGANDQLEIKVYQEPDLDCSPRVSEEGTINFPMLRIVKVGGLTVEEAEKHLYELLKDGYLVRPQVSIAIKEPGKWKFTITGQVQSQGTFEMPNGETLTLIGAIARANGRTRLGANTVMVLRQGTAVPFKLDLSTPEGKNFVIRPGDVIEVRERII